MHCLDCGGKLKDTSYTQSCTKWNCENCGANWFQTRRMVVEWTKERIRPKAPETNE